MAVRSNLATILGFPTGIIIDFAGTVAPGGWLICNGSLINRDLYPKLFNAIGYTYGGSGQNFRLPDCTNAVMAGRDNFGSGSAGRIPSACHPDGLNMAIKAGAVTATVTTDMLPRHTHDSTTSTSSASIPHTHQMPYNSTLINDASDSSPGNGSFARTATLVNWEHGWYNECHGDWSNTWCHDHFRMYVGEAANNAVTASTKGNPHTHTVVVSQNSSISNTHFNTQPCIVMNKIIKYD